MEENTGEKLKTINLYNVRKHAAKCQSMKAWCTFKKAVKINFYQVPITLKRVRVKEGECLPHAFWCCLPDTKGDDTGFFLWAARETCHSRWKAAATLCSQMKPSYATKARSINLCPNSLPKQSRLFGVSLRDPETAEYTVKCQIILIISYQTAFWSLETKLKPLGLMTMQTPWIWDSLVKSGPRWFTPQGTHLMLTLD